MRADKVTANIWFKKGEARTPFFLIEMYLDGELNESEKREFEIMLNKVPELKKELELRNSVNCAITENDLMKFRETLKTLHR